MKVNFSITSECELIGNKLYTIPEKTLVAKIYPKNLKYLEFHYISDKNREIYRYMKLYKKKMSECKKVGNYLYYSDGLYVCQYCNRQIMEVFPENMHAYAFYVKCMCDTEYDYKRLKYNFQI